MTDDNNEDYDVGYRKPPKGTQFGAPNGNPINKRGRKKTRTTLDDEIKNIFGKKRSINVNGQPVKMSARKMILEQIATGAAKGNPVMIRLAIPFLKIMDDAPDFEVLPEDLEVLKIFQRSFNDDGSKTL